MTDRIVFMVHRLKAVRSTDRRAVRIRELAILFRSSTRLLLPYFCARITEKPEVIPVEKPMISKVR